MSIKEQHPQWFHATGLLGVDDFQITSQGAMDATAVKQYVIDSETANELDNINRRDMRNWEDRED